MASWAQRGIYTPAKSQRHNTLCPATLFADKGIQGSFRGNVHYLKSRESPLVKTKSIRYVRGQRDSEPQQELSVDNPIVKLMLL